MVAGKYVYWYPPAPKGPQLDLFGRVTVGGSAPEKPTTGTQLGLFADKPEKAPELPEMTPRLFALARLQRDAEKPWSTGSWWRPADGLKWDDGPMTPGESIGGLAKYVDMIRHPLDDERERRDELQVVLDA